MKNALISLQGFFSLYILSNYILLIDDAYRFVETLKQLKNSNCFI